MLLVTPLAAPGALLRPAPRLLAGRAPRRRRAARRTSWSTARSRSATATSAWSTGSTRSCPTRSARCQRTPAAGPCTWSAGPSAAIFALLAAADRPDLPIASITAVGVAVRRAPGAAGRAAAAAPRPHRRAGRDHPDLPGRGRRSAAAGALGLPALVVPEAGHQAARARAPPRRRRLPRPDRGGRPVHREHDRLPRPDLRPALPPAAQGQRPGRRHLRGRATAPSSVADITAPVLVFGGADDGDRPDRRGEGGRAAADRVARGAVRDRARRSPRHADRSQGAHQHLAAVRRLDRRVDARTRRPAPPRPRRTTSKKPATKKTATKKAAAKKAPAKKDAGQEGAPRRRTTTKAPPRKAARSRAGTPTATGIGINPQRATARPAPVRCAAEHGPRGFLGSGVLTGVSPFVPGVTAPDGAVPQRRITMKYMLIHAVDEVPAARTGAPQARTALDAWVEEMVGSRRELDGARLHPVSDATHRTPYGRRRDRRHRRAVRRDQGADRRLRRDRVPRPRHRDRRRRRPPDDRRSARSRCAPSTRACPTRRSPRRPPTASGAT